MSKITIIVPVYNVEKYIDQCIQSLLNQTLKDIEIICVDDCSTDKSYSILKSYAKSDKRIKLFKTNKNSGQSTARNIALEQTNTDYVMFCDSDDWFEPNMCEDMLNLITRNDADLGICSVNVIYESDKDMKTSDKCFLLPDGTFTPKDKIIQGIHNGSPLRIMRNDIIKKHKIKFPTGLKYEDVCFSKIYNLYVKKIVTTSQKLYNYRRHKNSTMNKIYTGESDTSRNFFDILIYYLDYLNAHKMYKQEYLDFWTNTFINWTRSALMFTQTDTNKIQLKNDIKNFISKNYVFGTTNAQTDYIIYLILTDQFMQRHKYLYGLFDVFRDGIKTEYSLCKISFFKIKRLKTQIKYYIFGICVYRKDQK